MEGNDLISWRLQPSPEERNSPRCERLSVAWRERDVRESEEVIKENRSDGGETGYESKRI